jgi:hypothetical protein
MSILLREGRKEDIKKKYSNKYSDEELDFVLNISDLVDLNHKYTDWIFKNDDIDMDFDMYIDTAVYLVKDFDKYQSQMQKKDINQYKNIIELESALSPFKYKEELKKLESQVDKIYEDEKFLVIKPKTEESSCKYGAGTKWCVTQKGSGHFARYTSGNQELYFVIDKKNSTNENYSKIALHFDGSGTLKYWDSKDEPLDKKQISILEYAFPDLIDAIKKDYQNRKLSKIDQFLQDTFNSYRITSVKDKYFSLNTQLDVVIDGFETIKDMGLGHAQGELSIVLISESKKEVIDEYQVFITFKPEDVNTFSISVGFMGKDGYNMNLGLESWGIDARFKIESTPNSLAETVRRYIGGRILAQVQSNKTLLKKIRGDNNTWISRSIHGYTFGKNKGLIKKLVDYLDSGVTGTKLDFLVDIGKLDKKVEDGKLLYSHKGRNQFLPSVNWRGQHASFFASAKAAGILDYRKVGNQFLLIKGPNFDIFKEGKLKSF